MLKWSLPLGKDATCVVLAKQLHSHDGKDEDDDTQDEGQITESAHRATHDRDQQIQRGPRLG